MTVRPDSTFPSSSLIQRGQRALGIRPEEGQTVWLFFIHNFLLGIGTILIYVAANAILLENHPETSLPLAYVASAVSMILVGRIYAYFEHHLVLRKLAVRVLIAAVVMTIVVAVLVLVGHSVAAAVAIMTGYRIIYLLTNLEFWGVSAVVFDTRQSKRLFGVISSGDMPAKAAGAILAALVHAHADVLRLLIVAFAAFLAALYVLYLTIQSHDVHAPHQNNRAVGREPSQLVGKRFGGSELVFYMCLSLALLAAIATEIEYNFFINVKHRFHNQTDVIRYVSYILALTYGLAMLVKLLLSRQALDRFGVQRSLLVLPWMALVGLAGLTIMNQFVTSETALLIYFCGLYLVFEVIRRALFDPVFLVLFQPLLPPQRLKGHTLAKGLYEPLGLGVAGFLIFALHATLDSWVPLVWVGLMVSAVWLLRQTYRKYLAELNDAIGRRFLERDQLAMPTAAQKSLVNQLKSSNPDDVVTAIDWLSVHNPTELTHQTPTLLNHTSASVRERTLLAAARLEHLIPNRQLNHIALTDTEPVLRQQAAYLLGRQITAEPSELAPFLHHSDLHIRQGVIKGILELNPHNPTAQQALKELANDKDPARQEMALNLVASLRLSDLAPQVNRSLTSTNPDVAKAAIRAAGRLVNNDLTTYLLNHLTDKALGRRVLDALKERGPSLIPMLRKLVQSSPDNHVLLERIASICGAIFTPESRQLLNQLAQSNDLRLRGATLRALRRFPDEPNDDVIFRALMHGEIMLAQRLLHGSLTNPELAQTLDYELSVLIQRLFDILTQLYPSDTIMGSRVGISHPARERRANALEMLDNLIPRTTYQTLQVLVDELPRSEKVRILDAELSPFVADEAIQDFILRTGETVFTAWTISVVLRSLPADEAQAAQESLASRFPTLPPLLMSHSTSSVDQISAYDRVLLLARTSLFAQTPDNVLASITPIMREEAHSAGDEIFHKGDLGTGMYVIYSGEVVILDGETELARFSRGDFFGELALLDTEARSATVEAITDVRLLRIDQEDFYDLMEERSEVLRSIVRSLSGRIRRQNEVITHGATQLSKQGA
ncbi:cyclic nucleotide-binding domain-containing protein [Spirosoma sp. BT702]|uniref:Cyclic nucleotide-binding domain-containing protein n=1 Tax=Spirosoma profusum TaxID=2771354 RepID=A0A926XTC7_9BACT|nr:cyclic nucleotide-binding domain-containing protein [Spirosoma profusum]MBD2699919.1 cyclic nucleotide-binding domain-containing protein [Spirosoma profusum]